MLEYDRINISEGIDIKKQVDQNSLIFVIIDTFWTEISNMNHIVPMVFMIWFQKLSVLMMLLWFLLKEVIKKLIFGICAQMMQKIY